MALAAPEVNSFFLPLPRARKISLVGAQIFIFIGNGKGTKNPDAKQAFFSFISDLFEMLK
jgi:hypothetical protein